jgi:uncharacterized protein (DUF302 family)
MAGSKVEHVVPGDVASVVELVHEALDARDVRLFAAIDHAAGARSAGLELPDEVLLIFGSPAVGTALMQVDPRAGLDLPLRMLVWSQDGTTRIGYDDPVELAARYDIEGQESTLSKLHTLLTNLVHTVQQHSP